MVKKRPMNLNLFSIRFPVMAIVSISHRISGIIIFLSLPLLLWLLNESLRSQESYNHLGILFKQPALKASLILIVWSLWFHILAGIRHVVMDFGLGTTKDGARTTAWLLWIIFFVTSGLIGVKLWH